MLAKPNIGGSCFKLTFKIEEQDMKRIENKLVDHIKDTNGQFILSNEFFKSFYFEKVLENAKFNLLRRKYSMDSKYITVVDVYAKLCLLSCQFVANKMMLKLHDIDSNLEKFALVSTPSFTEEQACKMGSCPFCCESFSGPENVITLTCCRNYVHRECLLNKIIRDDENDSKCVLCKAEPK